MQIFKKYIVFIVLAIVLVLSLFKIWQPNSKSITIDNNKVNLYFFYGQGCPHCAKEEKFLDQLAKKYPQLVIHRLETWYNTDNAQLLDKIRNELQFGTGVPVLLVGREAIVGYHNYEISGKKIEKTVKNYVLGGCDHSLDHYFGAVKEDNNNLFSCEQACTIEGDADNQTTCVADMKQTQKGVSDILRVPIFGEINIKNLKLPTFTVVIAAADGFNPCSMWVLLFLLNMLIGMKDKKRMWILGLTFIFSSAVIYYFFVFTWLQIFLLVGLVLWVRLAIGLLAVGSGTYHLKEYFFNKEGTCKVTDDQQRHKVFTKVKEIVHRQSMLLAMGGIIFLAGAVNMVELLCSAGFPQTFTQVLSMKHLSFWQNQAYLFLYIFIFMADDLLIFFLVMKTMQLKGISSRYARWSGLVGGVVILLIGLLLLFKPEWIMFG